MSIKHGIFGVGPVVGLWFAGPVCVSFYVVVVGLCLLLEGCFVLWLVQLHVALSFVGWVRGRGCLYCGGCHWSESVPLKVIQSEHPHKSRPPAQVANLQHHLGGKICQPSAAL